MKRAIVSGLALALLLITAPFSQSANAADLIPYKAPPIPICVWCGWYVGAQLGGMWTRDRSTETTAFVPPATGNATTYGSGFVGGAHAGYNWQVGRFVFGPEVDFEGTSLRKTSNCLIQDFGAGNPAPGSCFPPAYSFSTNMPWQGSIRGRLGYTWANTLIYATGGFAYAEIQTNYTTTAGYVPTGAQGFTQTRGGATVGGGVEWKLTSNWIGRLEYRYTDFGSFANALTTGGGFWNGYTEHHRIQENTFEVGLSYLFGGQTAYVAPILTK
jgi:outer membrane immunogenic protein